MYEQTVSSVPLPPPPGSNWGSAAGAAALKSGQGRGAPLAVSGTKCSPAGAAFCFAGFCEAERRPTCPAADPRNAWVFAVFYNVSFATTEGYPLGPSWAYVDPSWTHLGPILAHLGPILAPSWPILASSWPHLGPILAHLGAILAPS